MLHLLHGAFPAHPRRREVSPLCGLLELLVGRFTASGSRERRKRAWPERRPRGGLEASVLPRKWQGPGLGVLLCAPGLDFSSIPQSFGLTPALSVPGTKEPKCRVPGRQGHRPVKTIQTSEGNVLMEVLGLLSRTGKGSLRMFPGEGGYTN